MKKIAIPVRDNKLSRHFKHCNRFYIYDAKDGNVVNETQLIPPPHEPDLLPKWLHRHLVTDVIVGGMGSRAIRHFNQQKINVFLGTLEKSPSELVESHLNGRIKLTGNYCDH